MVIEITEVEVDQAHGKHAMRVAAGAVAKKYLNLHKAFMLMVMLVK